MAFSGKNEIICMSLFSFEDANYSMAGDGKVTLWPGPLKGTSVACFPKEHHEEGTALVVFDTALAYEPRPLGKISGDAMMSGGAPVWINCTTSRCGLRWPYTGDASASQKTLMRAEADKCYTPWTGVEFTGKKLAADGESCGMNLKWEF